MMMELRLVARVIDIASSTRTRSFSSTTRYFSGFVVTAYAAKSYVATRGAPRAVGELRGFDVVGFDDSLASVPGARWLAEHGAGATTVFRGNSVRAVVDASCAGMGLAVLPCQVGDVEPELVRVLPDTLGSRTLCLVVHPELANIARVRAVIDFLVEITTRDRAALLGTPS